jgi:hypothetical protein
MRTLLAAADRMVQPDDLILEAPGQSYDAETSLLGTWTAGHTLLGWPGHQTQWRPGQVQPDPLRFYRAASRSDLQRLMDEVRPDWIFLGSREQRLVELHPEWTDWMDEQADRLIDSPAGILFRIRSRN